MTFIDKLVFLIIIRRSDELAFVRRLDEFSYLQIDHVNIYIAVGKLGAPTFVALSFRQEGQGA